MALPVSFTERIKRPATPALGSYPYQISAKDLDRNFLYAALEAEPGYIEETVGMGGNSGRKLSFPVIPQTGTHVLGVVDGVLTWLETEDC